MEIKNLGKYFQKVWYKLYQQSLPANLSSIFY